MMKNKTWRTGKGNEMNFVMVFRYSSVLKRWSTHVSRKWLWYYKVEKKSHLFCTTKLSAEEPSCGLTKTCNAHS